MNGVIDLGLWQMFFAYLLAILVMGIIKLCGVSREKELLVASIRMTVQLTLTGYVLVYLFESMNPLYTILVIIIMEVFLIYNIYQRANMNLFKKIKKIIPLSITIGTLTSIIYFLLIDVNISSWYDPRYFIPISGMSLEIL
jgi:putative ABC transport system permease protein